MDTESKYTCEGKYIHKEKTVGFIFSEKGTDVMLDVTVQDARKLALHGIVRNLYIGVEKELCGVGGDLSHFKTFDCAIYGIRGNAERPAVCWYCLANNLRKCFFRSSKCALNIANTEKSWQSRKTGTDKFKIIIPPEGWEG